MLGTTGIPSCLGPCHRHRSGGQIPDLCRVCLRYTLDATDNARGVFRLPRLIRFDKLPHQLGATSGAGPTAWTVALCQVSPWPLLAHGSTAEMP